MTLLQGYLIMTGAYRFLGKNFNESLIHKIKIGNLSNEPSISLVPSQKTFPKIVWLIKSSHFTDQSLYHCDDSTCCVNPLNHTFPKSSFSAISISYIHTTSLIFLFTGCSLLQWRGGNEPYAELNIQIILCGFVFLILPLFFISTIFKVRKEN